MKRRSSASRSPTGSYGSPAPATLTVIVHAMEPAAVLLSSPNPAPVIHVVAVMRPDPLWCSGSTGTSTTDGRPARGRGRRPEGLSPVPPPEAGRVATPEPVTDVAATMEAVPVAASPPAPVTTKPVTDVMVDEPNRFAVPKVVAAEAAVSDDVPRRCAAPVDVNAVATVIAVDARRPDVPEPVIAVVAVIADVSVAAWPPSPVTADAGLNVLVPERAVAPEPVSPVDADSVDVSERPLEPETTTAAADVILEVPDLAGTPVPVTAVAVEIVLVPDDACADAVVSAWPLPGANDPPP